MKQGHIQTYAKEGRVVIRLLDEDFNDASPVTFDPSDIYEVVRHLGRAQDDAFFQRAREEARTGESLDIVTSGEGDPLLTN